MDILREVREVFYENTGLSISFRFRDSRKTVDFYPAWERNEFCKLIQSSSLGRKRCRMSDREGSRHLENGTFNIYQCHAGLTDAVVPLWRQHLKIGAVYTGQVLTRPPDDTLFEEVRRKLDDLDLDYAALREAFFQVKYIQPETLRQNLRFLSLISNYVAAAEHEISLRRENEELERKLRTLTLAVLAQERSGIPNPGDEPMKHTIDKAISFIRENYGSRLTLNDVAGAVHLSPSYFSRLFAKQTGRTFSAFLTGVRIEAAKNLLTGTLKPVKAVSRETGFRDYNYFNRTFKGTVGVPPARYRKINRQSR
jgi:AraC-like DNA-binding protein